MKKIKLQNDDSMNWGIISGPMDGDIDLGESGLLDESGLMDESGNVSQISEGYEYVYLTIENAIFIRWVLIWSSGNLTGHSLISYKIEIDDGGNPLESGYLGDPLLNTDPEHYELDRYQVNSVGVTDGGQITGSCSADYTYYPCGRYKVEGMQNGINCTPEHKHASISFNFTIPTNEEENDED